MPTIMHFKQMELINETTKQSYLPINQKLIKRNVLLLLLFMLFVVPLAQAQQVTIKQVTVNSDNKLVEPSVNNLNESFKDYISNHISKFPLVLSLRQLAADYSKVARISVKGNNNITNIKQSGSENVGAIKIVGNHNNTGITQTGSNLFSVLNVDGNWNKFDITQTGNALKNYIKLTGNGIYMQADQTDKGMTLTQTGRGGIPMKIKTTGRMLIIRNK